MEKNYKKIKAAETVMLRTLLKQGLNGGESVSCCLLLLADAMAVNEPRYENSDRQMLINSLELVLNHIQMRRTQVKMFKILKQQNN